MAEKDAKKKKTSFFTGVKAEFGKISWPGRPTLLKQTALVTFISIVLGIIISVVDSAALQLLRLLIG
ncbi:MAG: preprotein translocase subunit SecE [Lachnospiraceae bacterium]|nr:preprotein translocase subunit SecE [Lachnospiraceae bacterium]